MPVGWSRPETTVLTDRFGSFNVGPSGAGSDAGSTLRLPNSPCSSSPGPAAKNRVLEEDDATPKPNCNPHKPGILIGLFAWLRSRPISSPLSKSKPVSSPLPKLPTISALLNFPNPWNGAHAIPHGELSSPLLANRLSSRPSVSKMSMNPCPGPARSSSLSASCFA